MHSPRHDYRAIDRRTQESPRPNLDVGNRICTRIPKIIHPKIRIPTLPFFGSQPSFKKSMPRGCLVKCWPANLVKTRLLRATLGPPQSARRAGPRFHSANPARNETDAPTASGKHRAAAPPASPLLGISRARVLSSPSLPCAGNNMQVMALRWCTILEKKVFPGGDSAISRALSIATRPVHGGVRADRTRRVRSQTRCEPFRFGV